jgi:DNA polymerase-3 subunit alpha
MPDFDIDFCYERRNEVIQYVNQKYGADHVAQIVTFGTMAAKAAVRDVGRVLGVPYGIVDSVAKLIPNSLHITLDELNDHYDDYIKEDVDVEEIEDCKYKVTQTTRTAEDLTMSLSEYREKFMAYYNRYVTAPAKEMNEKKATMDSADKKVKEANREITGIENEINAISASIASLEK